MAIEERARAGGARPSSSGPKPEPARAPRRRGGDPAQQGSAANPNIHDTYLVWSSVSVAGGGGVRTLIENGDRFDRCGGVPSLKLATVTEHVKKNGWARAVYGATRRAGKRIYG